MFAHVSAVDIIAVLIFAVLGGLFIHGAITSEKQYQDAMQMIDDWGDRIEKMAELENDCRSLYEEAKAKGRQNVENFQSRLAELMRRQQELFAERKINEKGGGYEG